MKHNLIKTILSTTAICTLITATTSFAAFDPNNIRNQDYQYDSTDVSHILERRFKEAETNPFANTNPFLAARKNGVVFSHEPLKPSDNTSINNQKNDIKAVLETQDYNTILLPIHNGDHWTALAIRRNENKIHIMYNNPTGNKAEDLPGQVIHNALQEIINSVKADNPDSEVEFKDFATKQQEDNTNCGPAMVESLMLFERIKPDAPDTTFKKHLSSFDGQKERIRESHAKDDENAFITDDSVKASRIGHRVKNNNNRHTHFMNTVQETHNNRLFNLNYANNIQKEIVIPSGDNYAFTHGAWIMVGASTGKQKLPDEGDTNNLKSKNVTIGGDTKIMDSTTIGLSATIYKADNKTKSGDSKESIDTYIGNLYGSHDILDSGLYAIWNLGYGKTKTKITTSDDDTEGTDTGTQKGDIFVVNTGVNYHYDLHDANISIVPKLGITYRKLKIKSGQFTTITTESQKLDNVVINPGLSIITTMLDGNLVPELYFNTNHIVSGDSKIFNIFSSDGTVISEQKSELTKNTYNVGTSVNFGLSSNTELSLGYEYSWQKNVKIHNGFVKIRINF